MGAAACLLGMSSCTALDVLLATPTPVPPTGTPLPSPTIVWFPPTFTATPQTLLTQAPTPEMRPGLGGVSLADDLSDPFAWDTAMSEEGSAGIADGRLTLAVRSGVYLISLRSDLILGDFYAEMTARPGLCRGQDAYGLLVRANAVAGYRFPLSCTGMVGAERVSVGKRQVLQEPIPSGDAPPGAPGEVRIGIWAAGDEMRLFLNDRFQFSIRDSSYPSGTVGAFVRSAGDTPVIVSFSDLTIRQVIYSPPIGTPEP